MLLDQKWLLFASRLHLIAEKGIYGLLLVDLNIRKSGFLSWRLCVNFCPKVGKKLLLSWEINLSFAVYLHGIRVPITVIMICLIACLQLFIIV